MFLAGPVPARGEGAVHDQGLCRVEVLHGRDEIPEGLDESWGPAGDRPADGGLGHRERLCQFVFGAVSSLVDDCGTYLLFAGQCGWPSRRLSRFGVGVIQDGAEFRE